MNFISIIKIFLNIFFIICIFIFIYLVYLILFLTTYFVFYILYLMLYGLTNNSLLIDNLLSNSNFDLILFRFYNNHLYY